jgi:RNA polymerase-binding transcription factor DksA
MAAGSRIGRALRRVSGAAGARPGKAVAAPAPKAAKKTAKKAAPARQSAATKPAPQKKKTPAKKAPSGTAAAKAAKKSAPAKAAGSAGAAAKKSPPRPAAAAKPAKKLTATKATPAKKSPPVKQGAAAKKTGPAKKPAVPTGAPAGVSVPAGSDWTRAELTAIRAQLINELAEMRAAYDRSLADLTELQLSSGDGAGDDQADAGSKTFEREQEQSIAANRLDLMTQMQHAVERIDAGTYGYCESCGKPIPKARLKAFPAATLDVACKEREERR